MSDEQTTGAPSDTQADPAPRLRRGGIVAIGGAEERSADGVILRRFVDRCGGDQAQIAVIPTASELEETGPNYEQVFGDLGVRRVRSLRLEKRSDCESEPLLEWLRTCDGVFLTGGNQLRLSTVIDSTPVGELLRSRNLDGMHIGGTSAGAAILSEHMIAYGEEGNVPRAGMAHLAPGLGIVRSIVVDQHFSQRHRLGRLLSVVALNPRLLGLGIDEDTAAFIDSDDVMRVVGTGSVTILDATDLDRTTAARAQPGEIVDLRNVRLYVLSHGAQFSFAGLHNGSRL